MEYNFARRLDGITGSAIREIFKLLDNPDIISFGGGMPGQDSFPVKEVEQITQELLEKNGPGILQYGGTEGWAPLRESILQMMPRRGVSLNGLDVLTLTGSSQGIDLAARVFLNPGDTILVESPTFLGALQTFRTYQANIVPVETDDEGIIPEALESAAKKTKAKMLYIIPTFQNPSGKTLDLARRREIAEITGRYGMIVIEDDPYCDLRYGGEPVPSVKAFDQRGNVILLQSFSKVISPGLRVGAAIASPEILRKMIICKQGADTHTSNLSQAIVDSFIRKGLLWPHVERLCSEYRIRRDAMLSEAHKLHAKYTVPLGGLFLWLELPEHLDALEILKEAIKNNVAFIPGTHFYVNGGHNNTMRLNFSNANPEKIRRGMDALIKTVKEYEEK
ncbi:MAG: aminotransferase-like domain-containing protein [Christensenellales bacterium]